MQAQQQPAPTIELNENTENALAGKIVAHQSPEHLDPNICMVCLGHTFGDAVMVTSSCQHHLHAECLDDAMQASRQAEARCPCGAVFPPGRGPMVEANRVHRAMMNLVDVECPQGCGEVMNFERIRGHVHKDDGCPNTPYRCGCGTLFLRKDKNAHLNSCPHRLVSCELCEQRVKHNELRQHKARQCTRRKVRCPHCKREYIYNEKVHHMQVCPVRREYPDFQQQVPLDFLMGCQVPKDFSKLHSNFISVQSVLRGATEQEIQEYWRRQLDPTVVEILLAERLHGDGRVSNRHAATAGSARVMVWMQYWERPDGKFDIFTASCRKETKHQVLGVVFAFVFMMCVSFTCYSDTQSSGADWVLLRAFMSAAIASGFTVIVHEFDWLGTCNKFTEKDYDCFTAAMQYVSRGDAVRDTATASCVPKPRSTSTRAV